MDNPGENVRSIRPFIPAKDFALSRGFYSAIGFEEVWSDESRVLFRLGACSFFLQDYFVEDWASNTMLDLRVRDVESFWLHLQSLQLSARFQATIQLVPPRDDLSVGIRHGSFKDPCGVLWHFSQEIQ